jgi:hypothetical protein
VIPTYPHDSEAKSAEGIGLMVGNSLTTQVRFQRSTPSVVKGIFAREAPARSKRPEGQIHLQLLDRCSSSATEEITGETMTYCYYIYITKIMLTFIVLVLFSFLS